MSHIKKYKKQISDELLDGQDFSSINGFSCDHADLHCGGRVTSIISTDVGKFVYKPHDLKIDATQYELAEEHFSDLFFVSRCICGDGFGFCRFIKDSPSNTHEKAEKYYYNLGGFCAVIQALGSTDFHLENIFSVGEYPVPIDLETVLTPSPRVFGNKGFVPEMPMSDIKSDVNVSVLWLIAVWLVPKKSVRCYAEY